MLKITSIVIILFIILGVGTVHAEPPPKPPAKDWPVTNLHAAPGETQSVSRQAPNGIIETITLENTEAVDGSILHGGKMGVTQYENRRSCTSTLTGRNSLGYIYYQIRLTASWTYDGWGWIWNLSSYINTYTNFPYSASNTWSNNDYTYNYWAARALGGATIKMGQWPLTTSQSYTLYVDQYYDGTCWTGWRY